MANTIKVKRSAVSGKVPLTTDLDLGELAINTHDGKLFLKKDDGTQAIVEVGAGGGGATLPAGLVDAFAASTPPTGWLECDGSTISRTTYADLFSVIGTTFGAGDGSTTFSIPDLRGEFIRGWDNGRGVDAGRSFSSFQADQIRAHRHDINNSSGTNVNGNRGHAGANNNGANDGRATELFGGDETRPRNRALLFCIKY